MLTNIGHKRLMECRRNHIQLGLDERFLEGIEQFGVITVQQSSMTQRLIENKWIRAAQETTAEDALTTYARNPLQHVERFNFEITTLCNFNCQHCRNGGVQQITETDIELLKSNANQLLELGIRRFDFIGGEVSKYGNGWLELSRHIVSQDLKQDWTRPLIITLYTNGWWLEEQQFEACGNYYQNDANFLSEMRANGVTHILFSIDGPEELHDRWRGHTGLYQKILRAIPRVQAAGIQPRLSVIVRPGETQDYLKPFAELMYSSKTHQLTQMINDRTNLFCNFIDSARGVNLRKGNTRLMDMPVEHIRCKAFFRPWPTIRIMANGAIGICPLMQGQEGYGNVHETPLDDLLNNLQNAPLYKLHASGDIASYLADVDQQEFGATFDHGCSVRRAVNLTALRRLTQSGGLN
jgi:sulfatase maturation enzyme AslB (radical SAM superfamily)